MIVRIDRNHDTIDPMQRIPTTLFTGFLGAGKTTIISHLIDELQANGEQVAYVKNEIGDADLDSQILQGKNIQTKQLVNGCICCTLTGPFIFAIEELIETAKPTRIIIEASGTADVATLAIMVSGHQQLYRDGVLTIIDVVNFEGFTDLSITAQNQTQFTDLIVFNKVELVDLDRKRAVVSYVRELNTHSPIIEAPHGKIPSHLAFGISSVELETLLSEHSEDEAHDHVEEDDIQAISYTSQHIFNIDKLKQFLENLPQNFFRVKGIAQIDNEWKIIQKVGKRIEITPFEFETEPSESKIILIGYRVGEFRGEIIRQLSSKL